MAAITAAVLGATGIGTAISARSTPGELPQGIYSSGAMPALAQIAPPVDQNATGTEKRGDKKGRKNAQAQRMAMQAQSIYIISSSSAVSMSAMFSVLILVLAAAD